MLLIAARRAPAQERVDVTFQVSQTTVVGQSVFVLGSLPELGGGDLRYAVKLEPSSYPVWKATVSLPTNRSYSYQFYIRNDAPGQGGLSTNGSAIGTPVNASTPTASLSPSSKTVFYHSGFNAPVLYWRQGGTGPFAAVTMHDAGPGRGAGESRWAARRFGLARQDVELYFTNDSGTVRDPASGVYSTSLDALLVQDGQIFNYVPAAAIAGPAKQYTLNGSTPSTAVFSPELNETRAYRVIVPRGYAQHTTRRYPVIYLHDGQNVFEPGPFGTWNADSTAASLIAAGRMREAILVGVDNGPNRLSDYAAPDSGGWSNARYFVFLRDRLKPLIDAQYRTLTGPDDTGAIGSSMGGQASMYMGWDYPGTWRKIGAFSGAWNVYTQGFYNRVIGQSRVGRPIRLYLDSGDSGTASDNYWLTYNLRDNLINPARSGGSGGAFVLERDLEHAVGFFQQHNEAAWAARLPGALRFLFPTSDEPNALFLLPSSRRGDVNDDDQVNADDLYAFNQGSPGPGSTTDVDRDGTPGTAADLQMLTSLLRSGESSAGVSAR
ncbi:MAG: hypothetical protein IBJ11_04485 [Phycisphaerales bacterium]|nr:hypothetical protein [Phycisphaerales bacterium]